MNTVIKSYINIIRTIDLLTMIGESFNDFTEKSYKTMIRGCPLKALRDRNIVVVSREEEFEKEMSAAGYQIPIEV